MTVAPISLCAMVPYPMGTTPSQRFRIEQWQPHLESLGISVHFVPFADPELMALLYLQGRSLAKALAITRAVGRRLAAVLASRANDAILIHRALCLVGPALLERVQARIKAPMIYDFDDAIFRLHTTEANRRHGWLKFPGKTRAICRLSDHVVVGNSYLADYARQFNLRVSVIPTSIDTDQYRPLSRPASQKTVVGWTGSSTSQTHLELFEPVLLRLMTRRDVEIRVVSNRPPRLSRLPIVWRPWAPATEVAELGEFDIGIMPMPDDEWARGKCALKALQCMAMGVPTVASAIGANKEVIKHGVNGLLAATEEEWLSHLERLIDQPDLRLKIGQSGRRTVEESYSTRRCASAFADVVRCEVQRTRSG